MGSKLRSVVFDAHDHARLADFWAELLGREVAGHRTGSLLAGDDLQVGLSFVTGEAGRAGRRLHLHLTSDTPEQQQDTVARVLDLGGSHLDVGQRPEEGHVVLADPEGNAFCVIEAGNAYLAGTGLVGEVACDGTREVGFFWRDALGWVLVWDQDQETAIQSPDGGTKVAWGGPPVVDKVGTNAQRFDLVCTDGDVATEADRLLGLGAVRLRVDDDGVAMADPDGNEFSLAAR